MTHLKVMKGLYICVMCGKSLSGSSTSCIKSHERIHMHLKSYSYVFDMCLNIHETSHTTVEPYTRSICGKLFDRLISLAGHERIHTGV